MKSKYLILSIVMLSLFLISIDMAKAETGTINFDVDVLKSEYSTTTGGATGAPAFTHLLVYSSGYNSVDEFYVTWDAAQDDLWQTNGNSTYFTCTSGCTGSGFVSYNKLGHIIDWKFNRGFVILSSPMILNYEVNIFDSNNFVLAGGVNQPVDSTEALTANKPMSIRGESDVRSQKLFKGGVGLPLVYTANMIISTSENYNITYPVDGFYRGYVDKLNSITTKNIFENSTASQWQEETFNANDFYTPLIPYTTGLYINLTSSDGSYLSTLINSTNLIGVGISGNLTIDKTTYNLTENVNLTWILNNTDGRIRVLDSAGFQTTYNKSEGNGYMYYYLDSNKPIGSYYAYLEYWDGSRWSILDYKGFHVIPENALSFVQFQEDTYLLSDDINYIYYINQSGGYINVLDSGSNLKLNNSALTVNTSQLDFFKLPQNSLTGTYTINLYNSTGSLLSSDTTYINFAIVNQTTATATATATPQTSLIDITDELSQITFGQITDENGEMTDVTIKRTGNKIYSTLLLFVILILAVSVWRKFNGKR